MYLIYELCLSRAVFSPLSNREGKSRDEEDMEQSLLALGHVHTDILLQ